MRTTGKRRCALAVCAAALWCATSQSNYSQQASVHPAPPAAIVVPSRPNQSAPASGRQVLAHLNLVLHWYRQWEGADVYLTRAGDELYVENGRALGQQVVQLEFQSALSQSALIGRSVAKSVQLNATAQNVIDVHNIFQTQQQVGPQIVTLKTELDGINNKIQLANAKNRSGLLAQREMVQGQLQLAMALQENLQKLTSFMTTTENANGEATELSSKIMALQRSVPAAQAVLSTPVQPGSTRQQASLKVVPLPITQTPVANGSVSEGLVGQVGEIFRLTGTLRSLDELSDQSAALEIATQQLRAPLLTALRATLDQGQVLMQASVPAASDTSAQTSQPSANSGNGTPTAPAGPITPSTEGAPASPPQSVAAVAQMVENPAQMAALIQHFKLLSNATLPLSQELILIEQSESNLAQLRSSIQHQYADILRSVLLRVAGILLALGLIWLFSEVWRRATFRYVRDARRRRQFLVLRRVITGFCMGIVIIFRHPEVAGNLRGGAENRMDL